MRDGGDVLDHRDFETGGLQRADSGFTTRAGALDEDLDGLQAMLHGCLCGSLGRGLRGEGGGLFAATEAETARGRPGNGVALRVGDGDHGVVEGRASDLLCGTDGILLPYILPFSVTSLIRRDDASEDGSRCGEAG